MLGYLRCEEGSLLPYDFLSSPEAGKIGKQLENVVNNLYRVTPVLTLRRNIGIMCIFIPP